MHCYLLGFLHSISFLMFAKIFSISVGIVSSFAIFGQALARVKCETFTNTIKNKYFVSNCKPACGTGRCV
jgi:hypothetical protein